ncbi:MAG: hypothetical protein WD042_02395 [Phycisphaeraceae bacterium]
MKGKSTTMTIRPEDSSLFTPWRCPASGIESLILTERPAPVQKTFYFTNRSFTEDGKYLWVMCLYPPEGGRYATPVLGVVDFTRDQMRVDHRMQCKSGTFAEAGSTPMVHLTTGDAYWFNELDLWKRGPLAEDRFVRLNSLPKELARGRRPERIVSHLTLSADGGTVNIDARFDGQTYVGDLPLDGSPFRLWQTLDGFYDHSQFSPIDPDVQMLAHEYWKDHKDFDGQRPYHRLWLIRRGQQAQPILKEPVSHSGHEWWDPDGRHIWYVHYGVGVKRVNLATREEENRWPGHLSHAYSDRTGRYLVADMMSDPVVSDCHVAFRDTHTGKEVEIVNRPPLAAHLTQCAHLHPHPQFCCNDQYICYTTTVHDRVDLALVRTADLIERTR